MSSTANDKEYTGKESSMNEKMPVLLSLRSWFAGKLFLLAGFLDESYAVYLDGAPRRSEVARDDLIVWLGQNALLDSITPNEWNPIWRQK